VLPINEIIQGDCLEVMRGFPDNSVDLVVTDPPYNIKKADWDNIPDYIEWCGKWLKECERVLKDNGSFYFFHNYIPTISKLMLWVEENTEFVFKQFIVWNKRFEGARNKGYLDGYVKTGKLRNYQKMAEYCLFYTLQDETGLTTVMLDTNNFPTMRRYFKELQEWIGCTKKEIIDRIGQRADHCFRWGSSQWDLPTEETYQELIDKFKINEWAGFREYEDLRQEYEDLRYTFNNQKTHHSVWNYEIAPKIDHITPKPIVWGGDNRKYIGIEKDPEYCKIARERVKRAESKKKLFYV